MDDPEVDDGDGVTDEERGDESKKTSAKVGSKTRSGEKYDLGGACVNYCAGWFVVWMY